MQYKLINICIYIYIHTYICNICLCLPDGTWHKVNDPKIDYRGWSSMNRGLRPAGLCWSSTHLVQCGPDEPRWSWTQIWVQARMTDYSLNWTKRSSAIQGIKGVNNAACPPESSPTQPKPGAFRPQVCHWAPTLTHIYTYMHIYIYIYI